MPCNVHFAQGIVVFYVAFAVRAVLHRQTAGARTKQMVAAQQPRKRGKATALTGSYVQPLKSGLSVVIVLHLR